MKKATLLLSIISLTLLLPKYAYSEEIGLTVNPAKIYIKEKAPFTRRERISISNPTTKMQRIQIQEKGFKRTSSRGTITITELKDSRKNAVTATLEEKSIEYIDLNPNTSKDINIDINIKEVKDEFVGFLFTAIPEDIKITDQEKGITAATKISAAIFVPLVIVTNTNADRIEIDRFTVLPISFNGNPEIETKIINKGDHAASISLLLTATDIFGRTVFRESNTNIIIPKGSNYIKSYHNSRIAKVAFLGIYKTNTTVTMNEGNESKSDVRYFFVAKGKELVIGIGFVLFLILISQRLKNRQKS